MKTSIFFLVICALSLVITSSYASKFAIYGVGATSCDKWVESRAIRSENINSMLSSWVQGFLSGMNVQRNAQTTLEFKLLPDVQLIMATVDEYCREYPDNPVFPLVTELYNRI